MSGARRALLGLCLLFAVAVAAWLVGISPGLVKLPTDFRFEADVASRDNFYDARRQRFTREVETNTRFSYEVVASEGDVLEVRNLFDVRKPSGEKVFTVERFYGVDRETGEHVPGYGDRNRSGYMFAPARLHKQDFTYWHVNYDSPARMVFRNEEEILGLPVYRYEADYKADQTENLGHLPGVPETRRVELDVNLQLWVEPVSGRMVKYEDTTTAFYVAKRTNERLYPWNRFGNRFTPASVVQQVQAATDAKRERMLVERWIPGGLALAALAALVALLVSTRRARREGAGEHVGAGAAELAGGV